MTHGGKRAGAGRKPLTPEGVVRTTVTLTRAQLERLKRIGKGNASAGVRHLLAQEEKQSDADEA